MVENNAAYQRMNNQLGTSSSTQVLQVQQHQQRQIIRSEVTPRERRKGVLFGLGITEIIIGSLSVLLCIVTLIIAGVNRGYYSSGGYFYRFYYSMTWSSQGIWCGAFSIVCGILGVRVKYNPSVCMYNANMVMSIIGANVMAVLMIMSSIAAPGTNYSSPGLITVHSLLAVLGFIGVVICIVHSAFCCAAVCCRNKQYRGAVTYVAQPVQHQPQQMVQLSNGQYMMVPTQTMTAQYPVAPLPIVGGQVFFQPQQGMAAPSQVTLPQIYPAAAAAAAAPQQVTTPYPSQQVVQPSSKDQEAQMQAREENPPGYSTMPCNQP